VTGEGLDALLTAIELRLGLGDNIYEITLPPEDGKGLAWLHDRGEVLSQANAEDGAVTLRVRMTEDKAGQAASRFGSALRLIKGKAAA
jgi:GTP-binding protein HflX